MTDIGQRLVERLNKKMTEMNCPVVFEEVQSAKDRAVTFRGSFIDRSGKELSALMSCPTVVSQFPENINGIADGYYKDWLKKK